MNLVRYPHFSTAMAVVFIIFAFAAQARAESSTAPAAVAVPATAGAPTLLGSGLQKAIDLELRRADASLAAAPPAVAQDAVQPRKRGVGRVILGAATGAVAGFFAGAYLGAGLEPDCNCDDPGLRGVLIGAPLGAVAGGIVGGKWFFR
jgi:hypothetical protein